MTQLRGDPINPAPERSGSPPPQGAPALPPGATGATSAAASASTVPSDDTEYLEIGFSQLAGYEIEITDAILNPPTNPPSAPALTAEAQIPQAVRELDQKRVMLKGFMLPVKVEGGLVTELLLMKDQSLCCFGATPRLNDWVSIKMTGKGVQALMDQPVTFFGRLSVGEMRENGYLVGIYSMEGEDMAGPLDF